MSDCEERITVSTKNYCQRKKDHKGSHKVSYVEAGQRITIHWHKIQ